MSHALYLLTTLLSEFNHRGCGCSSTRNSDHDFMIYLFDRLMGENFRSFMIGLGRVDSCLLILDLLVKCCSCFCDVYECCEHIGLSF